MKLSERRAIDALANFQQLAPRSAATHDLLGDLYRRRLQTDRALNEYDLALTLAPGDPVALLGRAAAYLSIGKMEEAIAAAALALVATPDDPRLNLLVAEALTERHRFAEAKPHLEKTLASIAAASAGPRADSSVAALASLPTHFLAGSEQTQAILRKLSRI